MKTLYLVRHAKAHLENRKLKDIDRPLLEKGLKRTKHIIDFLHNSHTDIDLIISSPALRAFETAHIFAHALNFSTENIKKERVLYDGNADKITNLFYDLSNDINKLMIVGHNPSITNFANLLLPDPIDYLPTSGLVCIQFDAKSWDDIWKAKIITNFVITPQMLKSEKGE